ncbi:amino acid adenylation domain-containing protein, partial [Pseudoduganella sp.]|uniref:amino acid adenylation domain-containing protein n=1 Tax=Pseudoduganella sp. TaxID=1880898 RepID=UPI0035B3C75E
MQNSQASAASNFLPLSSVQQVIWLDQCLYPDAPIYNIGLAWQIRGAVDAVLLARAVNQVANANDALRTVLHAQQDALPLQEVLPSVQVTVPVRDFGSDSTAEARAAEYMQQRFSRPFDMFGGLLWATELVLAGGNAYWLQCYHHLVNDGYGAYVAMHAVARAYNALLAGGEAVEAGPSYGEFVADDAAYLASARYERDRQFWREHYASLPEALFERSGNPLAPNARVCWSMPRAQYAQLEAFASAHGATPTHCLMAALAAWFARAQGKDEVVIGVPVHNRATAQYKRTVGMFSSVSPVRVRVDRSATFGGLLAEVLAELKRGYRHQRFPIAELNRVAGLAKAGRQQLYDITVTTMNFDGIAHFGEAATRIVPMHHGVERTPLVLSIRDHHADEDVLLEFVCNTGVLSRAQVEALQAGLASMLNAAQQDAALPVALLPLLDGAQRRQLLVDFNATAAELPHEHTVHQLFETRAAAQPEAVAVVAQDATLSYGALNAQANRIAHHLVALGVQPGDRVALCVERGSAMVAALLGILKAGAAYVPLDPAFPSERLAYMLADCAPAALVTECALNDSLEAPGVPRLLLDAHAPALAEQPVDNLELALPASQLAYVIYTSGSTGLPKGVMVEHGSVVNFLASMAREPGLEAGDTLLAVTTLSFDIAGLELYLPLAVGARVVLASRATASDAGALAQAIDAHGITVMQATPATWRMLLAGGWQGARGLKVLCGGEALPADLSAQLRAVVGELWNVYGPTETTIWSTCRRVDGACSGVAEPIGRPIANTQVYVLDAQLQPVPLGAAGELYIGGLGVARGYLDRPELTAERFVRDPFSSDAGARMYKTGDLARWRADGQLEYLGRNDFQVKVRGFRIELGEIETRLAACAGVRQAVVAAREDTPGDQRLVAYLIAEEGATLDMAALRSELLAQLPEYMVPSAFLQLDAFPLTPNNKLDRKALPAPGAEAVIRREYEAPQGAAEEAIAVVWQELLGVERVGRHDNFFELGGHSLLAVQAIGRLRKALGVEISLRNLFDHASPAQLAALAGQGAAATDTIAILPRNGVLPLSFAQQRLWFLDQLQPEASLAYHMPGALHLHGPLDRDALRAALDQVVARHESLRTSFVSVDGKPQQVVAPADAGFPLLVLDLTGLAGAERDAALERIAAEEAGRHFDLAQGPLVRGQLLKLGEHEHRLLVTQHHIVSDAWSVGVLLGEVRALYQAFSQGQADPLPPLALQYADYAAWQRGWLQGERAESQLRFWQQHLSGAPALLELPTDRPRPAAQSHRGARLQFEIPAALADALRAQGQRRGATLFMTLFAGWSALLARLSGQDDIVVGVPVANRPRAELEPLIGFFANTLALRVQLGEDDSAAHLLEQVKASTLAAWEHQDLPFDQVVEAVQPVRSMSYAPLFQVMFSLNNTPAAATAAGPLSMQVVEHHNASTQFDLVLAMNESPAGLAASLVYATDLFDAASAERLAAQYCRVLAALAADLAQPVAMLPLLDVAERRQLLQDFNASTVARAPALAHPLFEAHAAATPDALAVVYKDEEISYAALNARANRLAHRLLAMGVQPDDRVAICVERGIDMVAGVLGVLKAGACYLPLDPGYPDERLAFMLRDSAPVALLTHASLAQSLPRGDVQTLVMDADDELAALARQPAHNPDPAALGLQPDHLAYVIYTSGSTGQPKGVMNRHRGLANLAAAQRDLFDVDSAARVLQFASFSFDASVWEMAMALFNGATLYVEPKRALLPGEPLIDTLRRHRISHATLPSSLVATMPGDTELPLRCLVMAGEACPPPLASRWADRMAVFNAYGPTETTVCASVFRCHGGHLTSVPIGRPLANMQLYILDRRMQPVPLGVTGELYIGGEGLARGYLNRPELNAERFVRDPFSGQPGARLYRTGDLARWLPDGTVDYIGRNDFQVKLRGFRIELGEIEARLVACEGVREAAVMVREDQPGNRRLVAYVVAQDDVPLSSAALRAELTAHLAEFMVPSAFVMLDALPLTANGKVERRALPAPGADAVVARAYAAPKGALEQAMAAVWQELLDLPRVGRHDNFFELGGHSLMAVQVVARLRQELGVELGLRDLFTHPVLHECAALAHGGEVLAPIARVGRDAPLPLSFPQQRLWFIDRLDRRAGAAYHIAGALRLRGVLDRAALQAALDRIVARHESLRTTFHEHEGQAVQLAGAASQGFALAEQSLAHLDDAAREAALQAACAAEAAQPFDLAAGPLVRGRLLCLGAADHVLLLTQHHIVSDGWSTGLLVGELNTLYAAFASGLPDPLPALPLQYGDFAAWQHTAQHRDALERQAVYWSAHLEGAPELLELPTDRPRPPVQSHRGGHVPLALDTGLANALRALGQRHGATLYMVLFAAWAALLARLGGQQDVVVGAPVAGRDRPELEKLIGFFVNSLAVRVRLDQAPTVACLLAQVRDSLLAAYEHQDLPFDQLVELLQPQRSMAHAPVFQAVFSMNNTPAGHTVQLPGLSVTDISQPPASTQYDLVLMLEEQGGAVGGYLGFATDLFDAATVQRLAGHFTTLLAAMADSDSQPVDSL